MKKILMSVITIISLISVCSCSDGIPEIVKKTPGHEKWQTKIDYSNNNNWLNIPSSIDKSVDVIYYYPTCYVPAQGSEVVVSDIDDAGMRAGAANMFESQASIFKDTCNMFAPFYRQIDATYGLSLSDAENEDLFAYAASKDAANALDYYFKNYNNGRPFFIAGHSQGSTASIYLLKDYFRNHPDYYKLMIACYAIGYSVSESYLAKNTHVKFASGATDTGVLISYNTEGMINSGKHNAVVLAGSKAINPINWKTDSTYASSSENLGARINGEDLGGIADAILNVERGVVVTNADPKYSMGSSEAIASIFGPASYHGNDYGLFYYSLKKNVSDRITAWQSK